MGSGLFWFGLAGMLVAGGGAAWLMRRWSHSSQRVRVVRLQVGLAGLVLVLFLVLLVTFPTEDASVRNALLGLYGLLITAVIGLTATTHVGNGLAGLILRSRANIKPGDFIRSGDHFGRVTDLGLLHTEIQTEDRDLTLIPNLLLVTEPVTVMRSSGTIVSATVSLGYGVPRGLAERTLVAAAEAAGLKDCFVLITELGDYAVTYRSAGLLERPRTFISARSRLRSEMMDGLHEAGIEIVSPTFMNQRVLAEGDVFVPPLEEDADIDGNDEIESLLFNKADLAESIEALRERRERVAVRIDALEDQLRTTGDDADAPRRRDRLAQLEKGLEGLDARIAAAEQERLDA